MLRPLLAVARVALLLCVAGSAGAVSFPLNVEFDDGTIDTFGNVDVTEVGGDLRFDITLDTSTLGSQADLQELYFNLVGAETGLAITSTDVVTTPYSLLTSPSVRGGAGSSFDFGVNFGNGAGPTGNGTLQTASFVLSADGALAIADLLESSSTAGEDGVEIYLAVHVQSTAFVTGEDSETVGSLVPEPGSVALMLLGVLGLAGFGTVRRPR
jgi:hypothetical protein